MAQADHNFSATKSDMPAAGANRSTALRSVNWSGRTVASKLPLGYYVYTISVDGVVRYIGKGKGLRLYSHLNEGRRRLNRQFKLRSIESRFQQNLTRAVLLGAKVVEQVLADDLTEKAAYKLEYEKLREYVYAGKRAQLWNVTANIQTPSEQQAFVERLKRNLNSRDSLIRYFSGMTLAALETASNHVKEIPTTVPLVRRRPERARHRNRAIDAV
jgi:hypothetical protein